MKARQKLEKMDYWRQIEGSNIQFIILYVASSVVVFHSYWFDMVGLQCFFASLHRSCYMRMHMNGKKHDHHTYIAGAYRIIVIGWIFIYGHKWCDNSMETNFCTYALELIILPRIDTVFNIPYRTFWCDVDDAGARRKWRKKQKRWIHSECSCRRFFSLVHSLSVPLSLSSRSTYCRNYTL